jgi:hypothetical protein
VCFKSEISTHSISVKISTITETSTQIFTIYARPIFVESRVEETKAEDQLKTKLEAEAEEKQAANDPKFIKKSERRKARQKRDEDAGRSFKDEICPTDDSRNHDFPPGFGSAFVLFSYTTDCVRARKSMNLMKYNRTQAVECIFF